MGIPCSGCTGGFGGQPGRIAKQIVVTCYTGQQAGQTVAALRLAGSDAISLHGRMTAWEKARLPVEGSDQNPNDDGGVGARGAPCVTGS